jgi:hypothetical protein
MCRVFVKQAGKQKLSLQRKLESGFLMLKVAKAKAGFQLSLE